MANPTFAEQLVTHAQMPEGVQQLLLTRRDLHDAAADNPHPMRRDVWRACYADAPGARARTLLCRDDVTADDVDWVLTTVRERRAGPLEGLLGRWVPDADQQLAFTRPRVPAAIRATLANAAHLLPEVRLAAAADLLGQWKLGVLKSATAAATTDADLLQVVIDVESWQVPEPRSSARGEQLESQRLDKRRNLLRDALAILALVAHGRPQLVRGFVDSGVVTLTAAATGSPLPADLAGVALDVLTPALKDPARTDVALAGVLTLIDRPDTCPQVRERALAVLHAHDGGRALARAGVSGRRSVMPTGTPIEALSPEQLELLVLRTESHSSVSWSRLLLLLELVECPALDLDLATRLFDALTYQWRSSVFDRWLPQLVDRFPELAGEAQRMLSDLARENAKVADQQASWNSARTPGATRHSTVHDRVPRELTEEEISAALEVGIYGSVGYKMDVTIKGLRAVAARLGDDPDAWAFAMAVGNDFPGTYGQLVAASKAAAYTA